MADLAGKLALFARAVLAALAGFAGIRRRDSALKDSRTLRPQHVIAAGLLLLGAFIALLLFAVKFATGA